MREILFKAKRKDNGEWVEGYYRADKDLDTHYICGWNYYASENGLEREPFEEEINYNTLCQYTGLIDKNGEKIWENDIAHIRSSGLSGYGVVKYQNGNLVLVDEKRKRTYSLYGEWKIRKDGNIFDNADLLEVK